MNFTYKTMVDHFKDVTKGYIESYDMARIATMDINGSEYDYPVHSQEEFQQHMAIILNNSDIIGIRIYQSTHCYDIQDYID